MHISQYSTVYSDEQLSRVAFPLGGLGAGMFCFEGTGALSHVSLRNKPDVFHEPCVFGALCVKGDEQNVARVLEGPVPGWKIYGNPGTGNGAPGTTYGLPRFSSATFEPRFPFATLTLEDKDIPVRIKVHGWSPFIPADADDSGLPVAALEYTFSNPTKQRIEAVFSFNASNFMKTDAGNDAVLSSRNGFILWQPSTERNKHDQGAFCAFVDDNDTVVNCSWFRGAWFDPLSIAWKNVREGIIEGTPPVTAGDPSPGASIYVPFNLAPGEEKCVNLMFSWHVPKSDVRTDNHGDADNQERQMCGCSDDTCETYQPWYVRKFPDIEAVTTYWRQNYTSLRQRTMRFTECFYDTTLPPEVVEAVSANLSILKSPTVLRQIDGRLWCWEGCSDNAGCCPGSCTHVWNYAQALPHLFPDLERTLRDTEFNTSQGPDGHQTYRALLPIRPPDHDFHAAADGQFGGIMKVYREWRISGDTGWMRSLWPKVKESLDYGILTWDPDGRGVLVEPQHNTYDIEFWGPNGMLMSFYLGALRAAILMGAALGDDVSQYRILLDKGCSYLENELYNGEYFFQRVQWEGLRAGSPVDVTSLHTTYSPEALNLLQREGPKYQYGTGCLSDGVVGVWMAEVCGIGAFLDQHKVRQSLQSIHKYNLKSDLSGHANPQRSSYAVGREGGLLLCTWPHGGEPSLPFIYSNEVWTGIEYQVASHLMAEGMVEQGLEIVRTCRARYDGRVRNPFNEYECGHWYARAMSSYALIYGLTGVRYDAVEKTLYIKPKIRGDFRSFFSAATGYGTVGVQNGEPFVDVKEGEIDIQSIVYEHSA